MRVVSCRERKEKRNTIALQNTYPKRARQSIKDCNEERSLFVETCLGSFVIKESAEHITNILFFNKEVMPLLSQANSNSPLLKEAKKQLCAYCAGALKIFSLPLNPTGTSFQKKVWNALLSIPYGTTISYGSVAKSIDYPRAARAVGGANNKNPIPILIPCHRVIGANGSIVGYAGGVALKERLLSMEARAQYT